MRARLVSESFSDSYYEERLYESINEGASLSQIKEYISKIGDKKKALVNLITKFNKEHNLNVRKYIAGALILMYLVGWAGKNNKWATSREYHKLLDKGASELASEKSELTLDELKEAAKYITELEEVTVKPIFSAGKKGLIEEINKIVPGRLSEDKIQQYDKYDDQILKACNNLRDKGEKPDPNIIKGMMIIETGMNPRINHLGFQGFPQTKQHVIDGINKRYHTNFTIKDMYNAEKSAEFIYYYMKGLQKSKYVNNLEDTVIAYNWGIGNYGKYKNGLEKLPNESKKYAAMMKVMQKYFS